MNKLIKTILLSSTLPLLFTASLPVAQERVYGYQLMTEQERIEHRNKMRSFKTEQERERYRLEHHKKMEQRAKQQGLSLPEKPRVQGDGMGQGGGQGRGR